jgi:hypothetical protein
VSFWGKKPRRLFLKRVDAAFGQHSIPLVFGGNLSFGVGTRVFDESFRLCSTFLFELGKKIGCREIPQV